MIKWLNRIHQLLLTQCQNKEHIAAAEEITAMWLTKIFRLWETCNWIWGIYDTKRTNTHAIATKLNKKGHLNLRTLSQLATRKFQIFDDKFKF